MVAHRTDYDEDELDLGYASTSYFCFPSTDADRFHILKSNTRKNNNNIIVIIVSIFTFYTKIQT